MRAIRRGEVWLREISFAMCEQLRVVDRLELQATGKVRRLLPLASA